MNPVLVENESLLLKVEEEAESVAMTVGDDEEGAIADASVDILHENDKKMKVRCSLSMLQQ